MRSSDGETSAEAPGEPVTPPEPPRRPERSVAGGVVGLLRETVLVVAVALVVSLVVKTFLLQAFFIPSESMEQTLDIGDRVIVSKLTPGPFELHRGDVVVFSDPGGWLEPTTPTQRGPVGTVVADPLTFLGLLPEDSDDHLIKRVIGLPGDHVVCCDASGRVSVDDTPIQEGAYLAAGAEPSEEPFDVTVPAGELWVLGDNRQHSCDSRCHRDKPHSGFVPLDDVVGRAYAVVWPLGHGDWLSTPHDFDAVRGASGTS